MDSPKAKAARPPAILIVEDEFIVALEIQDRLEREGYTVCATVGTGAEAVQKDEECSPDLILMDITLRGGMSGLEAASRILNRRKIPIIFLTASGNEDVLRQVRLLDAAGIISKPFEEDHLLGVIRCRLEEGASGT